MPITESKDHIQEAMKHIDSINDNLFRKREAHEVLVFKYQNDILGNSALITLAQQDMAQTNITCEDKELLQSEIFNRVVDLICTLQKLVR